MFFFPFFAAVEWKYIDTLDAANLAFLPNTVFCAVDDNGSYRSHVDILDSGAQSLKLGQIPVGI